MRCGSPANQFAAFASMVFAMVAGCAAPVSPPSPPTSTFPSTWKVPIPMTSSAAIFTSEKGDRLEISMGSAGVVLDAMGSNRSALTISYSFQLGRHLERGRILVDTSSRLPLFVEELASTGPDLENRTYAQPEFRWYFRKLFSTPLFITFPLFLSGRELPIEQWVDAEFLNGTLSMRARPSATESGGMYVDIVLASRDAWPYGQLRRQTWLYFRSGGAFPEAWGDGWARSMRLTGSTAGIQQVTWGHSTSMLELRPGATRTTSSADPVPDPETMPLRLRDALAVARAHPAYREFSNQNPGSVVTIAKFAGPGRSSSGLPEWTIQFGRLPENGSEAHISKIDFLVAGQTRDDGQLSAVLRWGDLLHPGAISVPAGLLSAKRVNLSNVLAQELNVSHPNLQLTFAIIASASTVGSPDEVQTYFHYDNGIRPVLRRVFSGVNGQELRRVNYYAEAF